jgi:hypothetical protein
MQIQRYRPVRRINNRTVLIGGCVVALGLCGITLVMSVVLAAALLPTLALQAAGFNPVGQTGQLFPTAAATLLPVAAATPIAAQNIILNAGQLGQQSLSGLSAPIEIVAGSMADAQTGMVDPVLQATFDENALLSLCYEYSAICNATGDAVRNARFDVRSGGVIVTAEVLIPGAGVWQNIGVVLRQSGATQLDVMGVDVNGTLYNTPPGELSALVAEAETTVNAILRQLTAQTGDTTYSLSEMHFAEGQVTLILR